MRHECGVGGCFLKTRHPKWEVFDDCFPDRAAISNVDGVAVNGGAIENEIAICDVSGALLVLEWKPDCADLSIGQKRLLEALVRNEVDMSVVIAGDPETMRVDAYRAFNRRRGWSGWKPIDLEELKTRFSYWATWADPSRGRDTRKAK